MLNVPFAEGHSRILFVAAHRKPEPVELSYVILRSEATKDLAASVGVSVTLAEPSPC